jgi:hypothetical protein
MIAFIIIKNHKIVNNCYNQLLIIIRRSFVEIVDKAIGKWDYEKKNSLLSSKFFYNLYQIMLFILYYLRVVPDNIDVDDNVGNNDEIEEILLIDL